MRTHRLRRLEISPWALTRGLVNGAFRVTANHLPPDCELKQVCVDPKTGAIWLFLESKSFLDLPEGEEIPALDPLMIEALTPVSVQPKGGSA